MLAERRKRQVRRQVLLACLSRLSGQAGRDVSLPELLLCLRAVDQDLQLGYELGGSSSYSREFVRHLEELGSKELIRIVRLVHDAFMPKTFVVLTAGGRQKAHSAASQIGRDAIAIIDHAAERAQQEAAAYWRIYARPGS